MRRQRFALLLAVLLLSTFAFAQSTVTVTGSLSDVGTTSMSSAFARFQLANCGSFIPRVLGSSVIAKQSADFKTVNGVFTGTLYANNAIDCGGATSTYYLVSLFVNNTQVGVTKKFVINSNFDLSSAQEYQQATPPPSQAFQWMATNPDGSQVVTQPGATATDYRGINPLKINGSFVPSVDTANVWTQKQTFSDVITKLTPVIDVRWYGAKGDGTTDDFIAIQAAINAAIIIRAEVFLPCGTYNTGTMVQASGPVPPMIRGQSRDCTLLRYTGTVDAEATLKAQYNNGVNYVYGGTIRDISIQGNSHTTVAALELLRPTQWMISNVALGPANSSTGACLYVLDGVANTFIMPVCDPNHWGGWPGSLSPKHGLVFDGTSASDATTTSTVDTPIIQGIPSGGIALWLKNAHNMTFNSCQISVPGESLQVDASSNGNTFNSCLFEPSAATADNVMLLNGQSNVFTASTWGSTWGTHKVQVGSSARDNKFINGAMANASIQIDSGALSTSFEGVVLPDDSTQIVDNSGDTKFADIYDWTSSSKPYKFPTYKETVSPMQGQANDSVERILGTWQASSGVSVALSPTINVTGKAWRAYLIGQTLVSGSPIQNVPQFVELTDTANQIWLFGANYLTFTVDGTSGKFTMTSPVTAAGFSGEIFFIPNSNTAAGAGQTTSLDLAGTVKLLAVALKNSGYTMTVSPATLTTNRTWTIPDATDTAVGKATTDTLSNKTLASPTITGTATADTVQSSSGANLFLVSSTNHDAKLRAGASGNSYIGSNNADQIIMDTSGNFRPISAGGVQLGNASNPWSNLYVGSSGTNQFHFSFANTASRTVTWPDADITVSGAKTYSCGTTTTCANTNNSATVRQFYGTVTLSSGTATVGSISPVFTSTSSFVCTCTDQATTPAACSVQNTSTSSITVKGGASATINYQCIGN